MTITNVGYAGQIGAAEWAGAIPRLGNAVQGVDDFASFGVSIAGGTRALSVAAGLAWASGVAATSNAVESVSLASVPSGMRWDMIVLRFVWATKTTSIAVIQGGSNMELPTRTNNPGVQVDMPLALARVAAGQTAVQEVIDLRVIPGDGALTAFHDLARSYINRVGTSLRIGRVVWDRVVDAVGSPTWVSSEQEDTGWVSVTRGDNWDPVSGYPFQVRAVGAVCTVRGALRAKSGASYADLGTVPAVFRPTQSTPLGATVASSKAYGEQFLSTAGLIWMAESYRVGSIGVGGVLMVHGSWMRG